MKRLLKNKGSALVWAVCAMMVLTLIVAAMLTLGLTYYNRSLDAAAEQRAVLLAQSGANYAVDRMSGRLADIGEVGEWMPITGDQYQKITEEARKGNTDGMQYINATPVKVYFDNSVNETLEKWMKDHYADEDYVIIGSDVDIFDEDDYLDFRDNKDRMMKSNKSSNYAELYFSAKKVNLDDQADVESFVVKVTSVGKSGNFTSQCCATFSGMVFIDTDPKTGKKEVSCVWDFIGFTET